MRFLIFLTIAALVGSSMAGDVSEEVKSKFNQLLEQLKKIGLESLAKAAQQALDAGKASLVDLLTQLQENGLGALGKRGLKEDAITKAAEIKSKLKEVIEKSGAKADAAISVLLKEFQLYGTYRLEKFAKAKAAEIYGKVKDVIEKNAAKAEGAFADAMDKLKVVFEKIHSSEFYGDLENKVNEIKQDIDAILKEHNIQMRSIEDDIVTEINNAASKRAKGELGKKIAEFFKPHIAKIQQHIQNLGDAAKDHATNIHETLKGHVNTLVEKLQPHVEKMKEHGNTLIGHGNNAVDALKSAVTDILNETFKNMAGTIKDAINTGKDAVTTVTDHVSGAVQA